MTALNDTMSIESVPYMPGTRSMVAALTLLVWLPCIVSVAAAAIHGWLAPDWTLPGYIAVDGLTVTIWVVVTLFSGLVHSDSRR